MTKLGLATYDLRNPEVVRIAGSPWAARCHGPAASSLVARKVLREILAFSAELEVEIVFEPALVPVPVVRHR